MWREAECAIRMGLSQYGYAGDGVAREVVEVEADICYNSTGVLVFYPEETSQ